MGVCGEKIARQTCVGGVQKGFADIFSSFFLPDVQLYNEGARNFLLFKVPPFYHNFLLDTSVQPGGTLMVADTLEWNQRLTVLRDSFVEKHKDVTVFLFDTWQLYEDIIKDPTSQPETAGLRRLRGICDAYSR